MGAPIKVSNPMSSGGGGAPATSRARAQRRIWPFVVLVIVAAVHVGLVVTVVRSDAALDHDEIISQLVASGHLDDWQRSVGGARPTGTWATGADLRRFLEIDRDSSIAEVRRNLADLDIHPPLFFWALLGARSAGVPIVWSGLLLNVLAVVAAGAILFSLLVEVLDDRLLASLATAVFAFSPALIRSVASARQYPFLLLATVVLIWVTARLLRHPPSAGLLVALFAVGALGLLTETLFALALVGAGLTIAARWLPDNSRPVALAFVALVCSGLVAVAIFPGYFGQYAREALIASADRATVTVRMRLWTQGFYNFVTLDPQATFFLNVVAFVVAFALLTTVKLWYERALRAMREQPVVAAAVGVSGTALVGATVAYLTGRTPAHSAGWQYVIWFWPAIVVVGAASLRRAHWRRSALVLLVGAALLVTFSWRWERLNNYIHAGQRHAVAQVAHATLVIDDCLERGSTPGAAMWLRRDASFLQLAPGTALPPPMPRGADTSSPFLFQGNLSFQGGGCVPRVANLDQSLARLGFSRGAKIGTIGYIEVYRLEPR